MHCGKRIELKGFTECINDKSLKLAVSVMRTYKYKMHITQVPADGNTLWHLHIRAYVLMRL